MSNCAAGVMLRSLNVMTLTHSSDASSIGRALIGAPDWLNAMVVDPSTPRKRPLATKLRVKGAEATGDLLGTAHGWPPFQKSYRARAK
jgi:hypothetical protein